MITTSLQQPPTSMEFNGSIRTGFYTLISSPPLYPQTLVSRTMVYCLSFEHHKWRPDSIVYCHGNLSWHCVCINFYSGGNLRTANSHTSKCSISPNRSQNLTSSPWSCVSSQVVLWYDLGCNYILTCKPNHWHQEATGLATFQLIIEYCWLAEMWTGILLCSQITEQIYT